MTDVTPSQPTLIQQSIAIVRQKKNLMIFPTISTILIMATFVIGLTPLFQIEATAWSHGGYVSGRTFVIFIAILLVLFSIVGLLTLLFNAALTTCALKHIQQEPYTLSMGFKIMLSRFWKIFLIKGLYDGIAIYVKFMRYWVDDWSKSSMSMNLVSGLPWNDAVLLIIPLLVAENTGFLQTLKRSAELVKNKWGADVTLRSNLFSRMLSLIGVFALAPLVIGIIVGGNTAIIIGAVITVLISTIKTIVHSTTQVILNCALYLYAIDVDTSAFFDTELLKKSFRPLTKKELHIS